MAISHRAGPAAPVRHRVAPSRRMTWKKLTHLISQGYGQGHQSLYKPWLHITKRTSSPVSNIGLLPAPDVGRIHHYLSAAEKTTILLLKWLGAHDIREQYPAWPWPHLHPLHGLHPSANDTKLPGLQDLANEMEIDHGRFIGTNIPYVATLDVLSTWRDPDGTHRLIAHECKPADVLQQAANTRVRERLQLTGRYCREAQIPRVIFHAEHLPKHLSVNLDAVAPRVSRPQLAAMRSTAPYRKLIESLEKYRETHTPAEILEQMRHRLDIGQATMRDMLHAAIWSQDVDHDLSQPLELHSPLIPGGKTLWRHMHRQVLGDLK